MINNRTSVIEYIERISATGFSEPKNDIKHISFTTFQSHQTLMSESIKNY